MMKRGKKFAVSTTMMREGVSDLSRQNVIQTSKAVIWITCIVIDVDVKVIKHMSAIEMSLQK
jgi:hypothetical protein